MLTCVYLACMIFNFNFDNNLTCNLLTSLTIYVHVLTSNADRKGTPLLRSRLLEVILAFMILNIDLG